MNTRRPQVVHQLGRGWIVLTLLAIAAATVTPAPSWSGAGGPVLDSLVPADRNDWLDVLQNLLLFLPLGVSLSAAGTPRAKVWLWGGIVSTVVELVQQFVPGRDSSVRDVLANTLGTGLGGFLLNLPFGARVYATLRTVSRWLERPDDLPIGTASRLSLACAWIAGVILTLPAVVMTPSPPDPPYLVLTPTMDSSDAPVRIGATGGPEGFFSGIIDEVRLYRAAREPEAIRADMMRPVNQGAAEPDLVAAYAFDSGAGLIARDDSLQGHDGAIDVAAWTSRGRFGNALVFDGRSSQVVIPPSADLDFRERMTLEAWVLPTGPLTVEPAIIYRARAYFLYAGTERVQFQPTGGSHFGSRYEDAAPVGYLARGEWTHLAVSYDGQIIRLYVNGNLRAQNVKWAPHHIVDITLDGQKLGPGISPHAEAIREALLQGKPLRARVRCGVATSATSPMFAIAGLQDLEAIAIKSRANDLFFETAPRVSSLHLPFQHLRLIRALDRCSPDAELELMVSGLPPHQRAEINGRQARTVVPGQGSAWSFVLHSELLPVSAESTCTFVWIGLVVFPAAVFARRHALTVLGVTSSSLAVVGLGGHGAVRPLDLWDASAILAGVVAAAAYRWWRRDLGPATENHGLNGFEDHE